MNLEQLTQWADPVGAVIGFILTLMVLSYVIGDNFMFRLAIHIFIGVASGYAAVLIFYNILWNQVIVPLLQFFQGASNDVLSGVVRIIPALLLSAWMLTICVVTTSAPGPRQARRIWRACRVCEGSAVRLEKKELNAGASSLRPGKASSAVSLARHH